MAYEQYEMFDNAGDLLKGLAERMKPTSAGGKKVTLTELVSLVSEIGIVVVRDISDDEPVVIED